MDTRTLEKLARYRIDRARVDERDLSGLDLSGAELTGIDLRDFLVTKTNFEGTDFTGSDLRAINFASANCVSACFVGTDLRGAKLAFGYFHNADFRGADLRGARLADALCTSGCFSGADLRGAAIGSDHLDSDFRGADLRGAEMPAAERLEELNCDIRDALLTPPVNTPESNKRRLDRIKLPKLLKVIDRHTSREVGRLMDITSEGFRLRVPEPLAQEEVYHYQIVMPAGFDQADSVDLDARAVWCRPSEEEGSYYVGFQIQKISINGMKALRTLINSEGGEVVPPGA